MYKRQELAVTQANADKQAGEAAAKSEAAVQTAREIAQKEVEEAKAKKVESSLKAEKIVPAEIARQEAILQANAIAEKITRCLLYTSYISSLSRSPPT